MKSLQARNLLAFRWRGAGLSFRRWRWKWGRRRKLSGRGSNPADGNNQGDSAVEESLVHELLPLVAEGHSSIAAVSATTAVRSCSYPSQRPISTRSKKPASAKAVKLIRMRPNIRASSRLPLFPSLRFEKSSREKGLQPSSTYVVGRLQNAYSSQPFASTARAKRGYTCELVERHRLDDGASSSVMIHVFDVAY